MNRHAEAALSQAYGQDSSFFPPLFILSGYYVAEDGGSCEAKCDRASF